MLESAIFKNINDYKVIELGKSNLIDDKEMEFFKIEELTYEDDQKFPRREAFENIISSFQKEYLNLVYLILGDGKTVSFYIGLVTDLSYKKEKPLVTAELLRKSIEGNFPGSKLKKIDSKEEQEILAKIKKLSDENLGTHLNKYALINGIPGVLDSKDNKDFQGIDRLLNSFFSDKFGILIVMKSMKYDEILEIEDKLFTLYTQITTQKKNFQYSTNSGKTISENNSKTEGLSETKTSGTNNSKTVGSSESKTESESNSKTEGESKTSGTNESKTFGESKSKTGGNSESKTNSTSNTNQKNSAYGESSSNQIGSSTTKSETESKSNSKTEGESKSKSISKSETKGTNKSKTEGSSKSETFSENLSKAFGKTESLTKGESYSQQKGGSINVGVEYAEKKDTECIKYIDETLIPMIDYSKGKGLYNVQIAVFSENTETLMTISNSLKSLSSSKKGNKNPLRIIKLDSEKENDMKKIEYIQNFQMIKIENENVIKNNDLSLYSYKLFNNELYYSNYYSTNEIGIIAGLPKKEVLGLKLRKEVEFSLNVNGDLEKSDISIGKLVKNGNILEKEIKLNKNNFDRHIFVSGVTGTGKTTTCQKLLFESGYPFMVIEPAKTEYRGLKKDEKFKDMLVFTLGDENVAPFRINPLELKGPDEKYGIKAESISNKIDMIKGAILSSFDLEAAIPQIIEDILYKAYESKGWDITNNINYKYENPYDKNVDSFPTFLDVLNLVEPTVSTYKFDDRLKNDYIGSINARLKTFTQGVKGKMLCSERGVDFEDLLDRKVVLEIENIKNGSEKAFIMALILININEAIRRKHIKNKNFKHITLIEEAHRLLSKPDSFDRSKKEGVELFTDMLAEVRKYGECLIIADQIPNKLTPEILKNTNTKIIHKLFARDDKESIGSTMSLTKEQEDFLSNLSRGRAVVFSEGWDSPVQVQIEKFNSVNSEITNQELRESIFEYYKKKDMEDILKNYNELINDFTEIYNEINKKSLNQSENAEELKKFLIIFKNNFKLEEKEKFLEKLFDKKRERIFEKYYVDEETLKKNGVKIKTKKEIELLFKEMVNRFVEEILKFDFNSYKIQNLQQILVEIFLEYKTGDKIIFLYKYNL